MLPIKKIEDFVRQEIKDREIISHDFGHLKRVAIGGRWFVKVLDGTKEDQDLAYVAGLLHDVVRYNTEKIYHSGPSAERSKKILEIFNVDEDIIKKIVQAVRDHSVIHQWESLLHKSSFLSDKILEMMGAYIVFRRYTFIGENNDFKKVPFRKACVFYWSKRLEKYPPEKFQECLRKLVEYQRAWPIDFFERFKKGEGWVINLAKKSYDNGRTHEFSLEEFIRVFETTCEEDSRIKKEALDYIEGKKFKDFEKLIKFNLS